jgi:hypothetical protein
MAQELRIACVAIAGVMSKVMAQNTKARALIVAPNRQTPVHPA